MPGYQEEYRANPKIVPDNGIHNIPGFPQVQQKRPGIKNVGQETIEYGDPHNGLVFLHIQDIDHEGDHIGPSGKGYSGNHIKADPQAPGNFLSQIGNGSYTVHKTHDDKHNPQCNDGYRNDIKGSENFAMRPEGRHNKFCNWLAFIVQRYILF